MKKVLTILFAVALPGIAVLFSGCETETPRRIVPPISLPIRQATESVQASRAEALRKLMAPLPVRGIMLYRGAMTENMEITAEMLVDRLQLLGFNRVFVTITSETELDETLRDFIIEASRRGMPVEIVVSVLDFHYRYRGNSVKRLFRKYPPNLQEITQLIAKFQEEKLPRDVRIVGIVPVVEVQLFNDHRADHPQRIVYRWSDSTYGPGLDNDMMVRAMRDLLMILPKFSGGIPITPEVPDFFHEKAEAGLLTFGTITDFMALSSTGNRVILRSSGNKPTECAALVAEELADGETAGGEILVEVNLAQHTSVTGGQLRRRDWKDFLHSMDYLLKTESEHSSFRGLIVGPLSAIEFMRMEQD